MEFFNQFRVRASDGVESKAHMSRCGVCFFTSSTIDECLDGVAMRGYSRSSEIASIITGVLSVAQTLKHCSLICLSIIRLSTSASTTPGRCISSQPPPPHHGITTWTKPKSQNPISTYASCPVSVPAWQCLPVCTHMYVWNLHPCDNMSVPPPHVFPAGP